ncbi:hypothetical protein FDP41_011538 [Naegleria fowleri]|uniref:40S ribosomal protein S4 n=1 Tax=Naegleria fowleri TaxID=5763 RepID=A0A6A5CAC9_NAEFO|nr:uncharacterized protein FDP41_011538 [Naegleria fowleri]KAF0982608.1 hypothetical protein FDP41_011538 [Naegleria fowleri]CAG4715965.1 unnamed protein product [Naegleria fowleri]
MARGPRKHLKRVAAPRHWMMAKMGGVYAPKPKPGAHPSRESLPLLLLLRNRLKYATTAKEANVILKQRLVKVDGLVRADKGYPAGFNDVITIEKTNENFRLLFDTKGRFVIHPISDREANYKLCKVTKRGTATQGVPYVQTNDGRVIRFPDPAIKVNDTVKVDITTGKITKFVSFAAGNLCMITGGHNKGRIGEIISRELHPGSFEIVHVKDIAGNNFTTRANNVFVLGQGHTSMITLPKGKGLKLNVIEDRKRQLKLVKKSKKAGLKKKKSETK